MTQPETFAMDAALQPPEIILNPGEKYAASKRRWQGIPSIERAANGRLWATWYSGGKGEDNENHSFLVTSGDDGRTWSEPVAVIDPPGLVRAFDPCVWTDPLGRLWWYWCQTCPMPGQVWDGRGGVWVAVADNPGEASPRWTAPRRISHGLALNKAIVTAKGEWILPMAIWWMYDHFKDLDAMRCPGVIASTDQGQTWTWRGGAVCDERVFDEPMVVELRDGTLWMLVRTRTGITESFSMDAGFSWSRGRPSRFAGPSARFHLRRLASGRLLFINHLGNPDRKRSHLTAMLSDDDGQTWPHRLLLDERKPVSYPDAAEGPNGQLRIIYDFDRYSAKEVYMAAITESDILAGRAESAGARLKALVNRASPPAAPSAMGSPA